MNQIKNETVDKSLRIKSIPAARRVGYHHFVENTKAHFFPGLSPVHFHYCLEIWRDTVTEYLHFKVLVSLHLAGGEIERRSGVT